MSANHRRTGWATVSARYRKSIAATLPAPCVNVCVLGGVVHPDELWDVGHIVDAAAGGTNERSNLGPAHRRCNRSDGGKIGAAMTNAARKSSKKFRPW